MPRIKRDLIAGLSSFGSRYQLVVIPFIAVNYIRPYSHWISSWNKGAQVRVSYSSPVSMKRNNGE